jgi:hypothetical protein
MNVIIGCEQSQVITEAFIKAGHNAMSCDLYEDGEKGLPHYRGDVRDLFHEKCDLFIVHPPCTRLSNSGVRWLAERNLWSDMEQAARFFLECLNAPFPRICAENPIMHKYAREIIGVKYSQIIQPWQFGHPETKATCLWLKNLTPLQPTNIVEDGNSGFGKCHLDPKGQNLDRGHSTEWRKRWRNSGDDSHLPELRRGFAY